MKILIALCAAIPLLAGCGSKEPFGFTRELFPAGGYVTFKGLGYDRRPVEAAVPDANIESLDWHLIKAKDGQQIKCSQLPELNNKIWKCSLTEVVTQNTRTIINYGENSEGSWFCKDVIISPNTYAPCTANGQPLNPK